MKNILIVDDLEENLALMEYVLTPLNYKIYTSGDGEYALRILEKEDIELIISDVNMTGIDGYELCQIVKRNEMTRNIPVILITAANKKKNDIISGLNMGADEYLTKPIEADILVARVRSMLRLKELNDQLVGKERLEAIAQVAVTVNHEINNPLQKIIGSIGLLQNNICQTEEEKKQSYDVINKEVFNISDIVKRLSNIIEPVKTNYAGNTDMIDLYKSKIRE